MDSSLLHVTLPLCALAVLNAVAAARIIPFEVLMLLSAVILVHVGSHASIAMDREDIEAVRGGGGCGGRAERRGGSQPRGEICGGCGARGRKKQSSP
jgi:hypothetical protein